MSLYSIRNELEKLAWEKSKKNIETTGDAERDYELFLSQLSADTPPEYFEVDEAFLHGIFSVLAHRFKSFSRTFKWTTSESVNIENAIKIAIDWQRTISNTMVLWKEFYSNFYESKGIIGECSEEEIKKQKLELDFSHFELAIPTNKITTLNPISFHTIVYEWILLSAFDTEFEILLENIKAKSKSPKSLLNSFDTVINSMKRTGKIIVVEELQKAQKEIKSLLEEFEIFESEDTMILGKIRTRLLKGTGNSSSRPRRFLFDNYIMLIHKLLKKAKIGSTEIEVDDEIKNFYSYLGFSVSKQDSFLDTVKKSFLEEPDELQTASHLMFLYDYVKKTEEYFC